MELQRELGDQNATEPLITTVLRLPDVMQTEAVVVSDQEWQEGSEEVYTYLLCAVSPQVGEYEPGKPEGGFLYPAFRNRTADMEYINVFHEELFKYIVYG